MQHFESTLEFVWPVGEADLSALSRRIRSGDGGRRRERANAGDRDVLIMFKVVPSPAVKRAVNDEAFSSAGTIHFVHPNWHLLGAVDLADFL